MKGRLCWTYSGGYASIASTRALLQGHEAAGYGFRDAEVLRGDFSTTRDLTICRDTPCAVIVWNALRVCMLARAVAASEV
jgi:hypothetical protein